jgi:hypothetical protein
VIELVAALGDQASENIEAPGCAFRVCDALNVIRQVQPFKQRDNVHRSRLKYGRRGRSQVDGAVQQLVDFGEKSR